MSDIKIHVQEVTPSDALVLQTSKTVTPTERRQVVYPDEGYNGLQQLIVEAMSEDYVEPADTVTAEAKISADDWQYELTDSGGTSSYIRPYGLADVGDCARLTVDIPKTRGAMAALLANKCNLDNTTHVVIETVTKITRAPHFKNNVDYPNAMIVGPRAFYHAEGSVFLPACVEIGEEAFLDADCSEIDLRHVQRIGARAFKNASVYDLDLRDVPSLPRLGQDALTGASFGTIYVPSDLYRAFLRDPIWSQFEDAITKVSR